MAVTYSKKWKKEANGEMSLGYKADGQEGSLHIYRSGERWGVVINTPMAKKDLGANCTTKQEAYNKAKEAIEALVR